MPKTRPADHISPASPELVAPAEPVGLDEWRANVAFYRAHLSEWAEHQGEHVLIYRGQTHGFYASRHEALLAGVGLLGDVSFLVKQVDLHEKPRPLVSVIL